MKQIVCLATSPWHPIPTRKQQVMERLTDFEILYFDPSVTYIAPFKDGAAKEKLKAYRQPEETIRPGLTVCALPPVLPFFNKYRFINRINQHKIARYLRKKMAEHGFETPILWVYSPVCADLVDLVPHSALVYDCVDRHSAYGGLMDPKVVDEMEADLAGKADQVFATAQSLADDLKRYNPTAAFIPNGANFERFLEGSREQPCPEDLKDVPHPILGFVGALQPCIEYGFLERAAREHPQWSFVFIGGEKPGANLAPLKALSNCHFLGIRKNEQLPKYLAQFDVCLNVFAAGDLSRDVSPLKFYEYLATGKPIVSTPQPEQVLQYARLIHVAPDAASFSQCCQNALREHDTDLREARIEAGRASSWDARVEQMRNILEERRIFPPRK